MYPMLLPLIIAFLAHKHPNAYFAYCSLAFWVVGTVIVLRSVLYNFRRGRHCAELSRDLDTLLDTGKISLPEYLAYQSRLAMEAARLDGLTRP